METFVLKPLKMSATDEDDDDLLIDDGDAESSEGVGIGVPEEEQTDQGFGIDPGNDSTEEESESF